MTLAEENGVNMVFPDDYKVTQDYFETAYVIKDEPDFDEDFQLDLGPKTIENFGKKILLEGQSSGEVQNVFWNGPLGAYDHPDSDQYAEGSIQLAGLLFLAAINNENLSVVIGGGDSAAIVNKLNLEDMAQIIREKLMGQLHGSINSKLISMGFTAEDTYTFVNYLTSNFFVSTGGGAALEFIESYLDNNGKLPISAYLPGTAILMDLKSA